MKKMRMIAMVLALCVLLSVPAMAAGGPVAENDKATVTVVEGAGASVAFNTANPEIIEVTVTSELLVPGDQYVILMVKSADGVNYDLDDPANILYINQTEQAGAAASGTNGSVSFNVYPSALTDSIILIAGAKDGLIKAAIVDGKYILGDANDDGKVSGRDAVAVLRYVAGLPNNKFNEQAANVNGDGKISGLDAVRLLRFIAFAEELG